MDVCIYILCMCVYIRIYVDIFFKMYGDTSSLKPSGPPSPFTRRSVARPELVSFAGSARVAASEVNRTLRNQR